jgi:outer membrane protein assembly factor BamB
MRVPPRYLLGFLLPALALSASGAPVGRLSPSGDDWPSFRGPKSSAVSADKGLPVKWSEKENLAWKTALPGPGGSSPIVWGNRVFVTCYTGYGIPGDRTGQPKDLKRHLLCLDRKKGTILWDKEIEAKQPETRYGGFLALHGYASSTPVTDGDKVYVFFGKSGVFAFDFKGKQIWQASVGTGTDGWGSATSPVLYKDLLIINASVESGAIVALKKKDGTEEWKADGVRKTWNSPVLVDVGGGKQEVVVRATRSLLGFDPAKGKKLWHCDGFGDGYVCPTAVAKGGVVYSLGGRFQGMNVAVKAGGDGDVTNTNQVWSTKQGGMSIPSPALYGDHLYWVTDGGMANCVKAKDGEKVYAERLKNSGTLYASITIADGKIYAVSRNKGIFVLAAKPKFEVLAHNTFESDKSVFNGSPAVSNGQLLIRSDKYIYCIGKK